MAKNPQVLSLSCLLSSPGGEPCRNGGEPKAGSPPTLLPQLERKPQLLGLHCQKSSKIRALGELFATLPSRIFYIFITCCLQTSDNVGERRCYRWGSLESRRIAGSGANMREQRDLCSLAIRLRFSRLLSHRGELRLLDHPEPLQGSAEGETVLRRKRLMRFLPIAFPAILVALWQFGVSRQSSPILPGPWSVVTGLAELIHKGLLFKYIVASLFRVTWGYLSAVVLAIPTGLFLGWHRRAAFAFNPLIQVLRPISAPA